ncbi:hypothetical protein ACVWZZ_007500 [Bradyrhizobium sp. LM6.10]
MIIADATKETVEEHIPALVKQGHGSIKIFMTYDRLKVDGDPPSQQFCSKISFRIHVRHEPAGGLGKQKQPRSTVHGVVFAFLVLPALSPGGAGSR